MGLRWCVMALGVMAWPRPALAGLPKIPEHVLSVGPSLALVGEPEGAAGLGYGLDATLTADVAWAGGGVRAFENGHDAERRLWPYVEAGIYLIVNLGLGYTVDVGDLPDQSGPHFFAGLPLPLSSSSPSWADLLVVEPYYRATFREAGTMHEAGVLLKAVYELSR